MQTVYGDGGFDALAYGETHPNVVRFIDEQRGRLSSVITDAGRDFMGYVNNLVDRVQKSELGQRIQALSSKAASLWDADTVRVLSAIEEFQHAKSQMRRWIMAEPTIRRQYHDQRIAGYDELYDDEEPDRIGEAHYDYRRVMDGRVVDTEDGDWVSTTYFEELRDGDRDLTLSEQVSISVTWERVLAHLDRQQSDPTSPTNAAL